jgi:hypothetical protein
VIQTCDASGTTFDSVLYLRTADCAGEVACNDDAPGCFTGEPNDHHASRLTPSVVAGMTYFIVVDGYGGARGDFTLAVTAPGGGPAPTATPGPAIPTRTATPTPAATPNAGTCAQPIVVPPAGGSLAGSTTGAASALAGPCATSGNAPESVFAWTPSRSGAVAISTCGAGTSFDTVLYVRTATCGGAGAALACDDDAASCATASDPEKASRLQLDVTAGTTYFIVVDGYNGARGSFSLNVAFD